MQIIIDVGSSTVKVYKIEKEEVKSVEKYSIFFKEGFTKGDGLNNEIEKEFLYFLSQIRRQNEEVDISVYATSLFRKMSDKAQRKIANKILETINSKLEILSHKSESYYLQQALIGKFKNGTVLITNVGGGSTELILTRDQVVLQSYELENLGVGTILKKYPEINNEFSRVELVKIIKEVTKKLPEINNKIFTAFFTGGELTYMKLAGYNLVDNNLFEDRNHPYIISNKDCSKKNAEIFTSVKLKELEGLMPENPKWMHGARAYVGIAQAITEKYSIENIIPSDINLVDGIIACEFSRK